MTVAPASQRIQLAIDRATTLARKRSECLLYMRDRVNKLTAEELEKVPAFVRRQLVDAVVIQPPAPVAIFLGANVMRDLLDEDDGRVELSSTGTFKGIPVFQALAAGTDMRDQLIKIVLE